MTAQLPHTLAVKLRILQDLGCHLNPASSILDFGCGAGETVRELRDRGYQAFGCDLKLRCDLEQEDDKNADSTLNRNLVRTIKTRPYRLPFDDSCFDLINSDQVLEHVQNYSEAISEMNRVLKPDGCCLHIFPSRYMPIESHVSVPFSSIITSHLWLLFWAQAGIRNKYQTGLSARETARRNHEYLTTETNYLSKKQLARQFRRYFDEVVFCERLYLKYAARGRASNALSTSIPWLPSIYSTFGARVLFTRRPKTYQRAAIDAAHL